MTQQQQNQLTASLFRQLYLARMMHKENEYFLKFPAPSGIKNVLKRMKDSYINNLAQLKSQLPKSSGQVTNDLDVSDEKINAMCNIFEKIAMLDEETVLALENDFEEQVKIKY